MDKLIEMLMYYAELEVKFNELMDGQMASDIKYLTGLPEGKCQEIYDFYTNKVLNLPKIGK
jgi:hypothetical protein